MKQSRTPNSMGSPRTRNTGPSPLRGVRRTTGPDGRQLTCQQQKVPQIEPREAVHAPSSLGVSCVRFFRCVAGFASFHSFIAIPAVLADAVANVQAPHITK